MYPYVECKKSEITNPILPRDNRRWISAPLGLSTVACGQFLTRSIYASKYCTPLPKPTLRWHVDSSLITYRYAKSKITSPIRWILNTFQQWQLIAAAIKTPASLLLLDHRIPTLLNHRKRSRGRAWYCHQTILPELGMWSANAEKIVTITVSFRWPLKL